MSEIPPRNINRKGYSMTKIKTKKCTLSKSEQNRLRNFPPQMEGYKVCIGCNKKVHMTNFGEVKRNVDGRCGKCKQCVSEYNRQRNFPPQQNGYKVCTGKCHKKLHITEFGVVKHHVDGRDGQCRKCATAYQVHRRNTIPEVKIVKNLRGRLGKVLKGKSKSDSTLKLLGCTLEYLKQYLESQFTEGMTWDNYGKIKGVVCWEIDHILPCTSFDLNKDEEQQKCFNYINLQPLWAKDNRSKGSKTG